MNSLIQKLQVKLEQDPGNRAIQETLTHLKSAQESTTGEEQSPQTLQSELEALERDGVVDAHDISRALEYVKDRRTQDSTLSQNAHEATSHPSSDAVRYVEANLAQSTVPRLAIPSDAATVLPLELVESLKQTYFLHLLATNPAKVLPPGKSLLSVLSRPQSMAQQEPSVLQKQVENMMHTAFWDEAYESLSNPVPSVQIGRLKYLYQDLHSILSPLLPSNHPIVITLSLPLSPTSAPLRSTITHLREIIHSLRERCAPSRDSQVDALMSELDGASNPASDLARIIVDVVKALMSLAQEMKDDLSQFVLGSMDEQQLHEIVVVQAAASERGLVSQLWRPSSLQQLWKHWLEDPRVETTKLHSSVKERFLHRLMRALGENEPVFCNLPTVTVDASTLAMGHGQSSSPSGQLISPDGNSLPPPMFFSATSLLLLQNYLQALVIAASLQSLVRLPHRPVAADSTAPAAHAPSSADFSARIWTLLKTEIEGKQDADSLKVINLADEVVRVRRSCGGAVDADEEGKLRAAVDRTLQFQDPVFQLLQRRLIRGIAEALAQPLATAQHQATPVRMRAGRSTDSARKPARPLMSLGLSTQVPTKNDGNAMQPITIKGFEDPVLVSAVGEIAAQVRGCVDWVEYVWSDLFEEAGEHTPR